MNEAIAVSLMLMNLFAGTGPVQSTGGRTRISACSVMPKELVEKHSENPKLVRAMPPEEMPIGTLGSSCDYGLLGIQVNPFAAAGRPASPGKDWQPVSGLGDGAYFRANRGLFAELIVWTGPHHFTIQYSVPTGSTAEAVKPVTLEFARAIIARLR